MRLDIHERCPWPPCGRVLRPASRVPSQPDAQRLEHTLLGTPNQCFDKRLVLRPHPPDQIALLPRKEIRHKRGGSRLDQLRVATHGRLTLHERTQPNSIAVAYGKRDGGRLSVNEHHRTTVGSGTDLDVSVAAYTESPIQPGPQQTLRSPATEPPVGAALENPQSRKHGSFVWSQPVVVIGHLRSAPRQPVDVERLLHSLAVAPMFVFNRSRSPSSIGFGSCMVR
jgi:hypothetical protein